MELFAYVIVAAVVIVFIFLMLFILATSWFCLTY
jgi:hypothetical protein